MKNKDGDWGLGIGDWGLGIGHWAQSPIPNPQSPSPIPIYFYYSNNYFCNLNKINYKIIKRNNKNGN